VKSPSSPAPRHRRRHRRSAGRAGRHRHRHRHHVRRRRDRRAPGRARARPRLERHRPAAVEALVDDIAKEFGPVSILVNNAGITRDNLLMRMKDEDWQAILDTNLTSVYRTSKAVMRGMMKARKGRIVNIASVIGVTGNAGQANYAAAKAGIIGSPSRWPRKSARAASPSMSSRRASSTPT
jgi:NAD(P)-dependent dehydrogenase (short-subunit alcohol dehydrogenase family)